MNAATTDIIAVIVSILAGVLGKVGYDRYRRNGNGVKGYASDTNWLIEFYRHANDHLDTIEKDGKATQRAVKAVYRVVLALAKERGVSASLEPEDL